MSLSFYKTPKGAADAAPWFPLILLLRRFVLDLEAKWLTPLVPLAWALGRRPNSSKTLIRSFVLY